MSDNEENNSLIGIAQTKVYKRRWFMLMISSLNISYDAMLFAGLSGINNIVSVHYNVSPVSIEYLSNMMLIATFLLALPTSYIITKFGVRPILITAAFLHSLACICRCFAYGNSRFWLVVISQIFPSLVTSALQNITARISSLWFPLNERATATSINAAFAILGLGVGNLLPSLFVKMNKNEEATGDELKTLFILQLSVSLFVLLITLFYEEQSPLVSLQRDQDEEISFKDGMIILKRNRNFLVLSQAYGIYFALLFSTPALINPVITSKFHHGYESLIGIMNLCNILAGLASFVCIGRLIDRYHEYKVTAILLNLFSALSLLSFFLVLTYSSNFTLVFLFYVIFGLSYISNVSVGLEQAAEMTYPVQEHVSTAVLMFFGNAYGFLFLLVFGTLVQNGDVNAAGYSMVVLYFISSVLSFFSKTEHNQDQRK